MVLFYHKGEDLTLNILMVGLGVRNVKFSLKQKNLDVGVVTSCLEGIQDRKKYRYII